MEVTISDTTFWKQWNTLGDLERFFAELDYTKLSPDQAEQAEELREAVGWGMNNLTPAMQHLKDRENNSEACTY